MFEVLRYQAEDGRQPFTEWLESIRDKAAQARLRVRLRRLEAGLLATASRSAKACLSFAIIKARDSESTSDATGAPS